MSRLGNLARELDERLKGSTSPEDAQKIFDECVEESGVPPAALYTLLWALWRDEDEAARKAGVES